MTLGPSSHRPASVDFDTTPFLVIWETTQACALACRHCRASAKPERDPAELTTDDGRDLIDQVARMGTPLLVLSGGDPANRPDLSDLIRHAKRQGLRVATIPAATANLTRELVEQLRDAGLDQMAVSLDFPNARLHDSFRGVPGSFSKTMAAVDWAHQVGLALQINTTVCGDTARYLEPMAGFIEKLGIVFWEVFFLVPVGRADVLDGLDPDQCEDLFEIISRVQRKERFIVKVTEAPHYRRYVAEREDDDPRSDSTPARVVMPDILTRSEGPGRTVGLAPRGVNAGNGFLFVSHLGDIFPSGFLPLSAGNLRSIPLAEAYRSSELFIRLRKPDLLHGRCGRCEYREICGGSRSRAFALTGDVLASDPWCGYQPADKSVYATGAGSL